MAEQVHADEFLDMAAFYLALSAVDQVLIDLEQLKSEADPAAAPSGIDLDRLQRHRQKAAPYLRHVAPMVDAGIDSLLRDAAEKAKLRMKTKIDAAIRGSSFGSYSTRADFLEFFLPRLKAHQNVLRDVFSSSPSTAIRIIHAAETSAPIPRLFQVAGTRMAAGGKLSILKKWTHVATEICGNPVTETEEVAVDVSATNALLDQVDRNNRKLDGLDPTDPTAAAVTEANSSLMNEVQTVAEDSKNPASVKAHAAARVAKGDAENKGGYTTAVSAHLKMTPEQEESLLVRGKAVIAAGAGSGKTRVLAGKVIHHLQDLGLSMSNVMAVSFTIKSSTELKERILKYGKEIGYNLPDPDSDYAAYAGIGTTHSIGRNILKKGGGGWKTSPTDAIKGAEISKLIKVAIAQVKMRPVGGNAGDPPPSAMSFFPNLPSNSHLPKPTKIRTKAPNTAPPEEAPAPSEDTPAIESQSPIQNPVQEKSPLDFYMADEGRFKVVVTAAMDTIQDFLSSIPKVKTYPVSGSGWARAEIFGPALERFGDDISNMSVGGSRRPTFKARDNYGPDRFVFFSKREFDKKEVEQAVNEALGVNQATNALNALKTFSGMKPEDLSPNERKIFEGIITNPLVASGLTARNVLVKTSATKSAADEPGEEPPQEEKMPEVSESGIDTAVQRKLKNLDYPDSPYYFYLHNAANQWFNIGATEDDFKVEDEKGQKKDIPVGEFSRYVGLNKNSLKAPGSLFKDREKEEAGVGEEDEDLYEEEGDPKGIFAAVYGAYEWLKGNIPQLQGRLDFDDLLIQSSRELIENPQLLSKFQKQYKCVLVDEAQDLNPAQHMMFGLIAGYIDPSTLQPRADGKTSADTFALIGDDKQAIYEFRGADPDQFIEKSDLVPGGEGFSTKLLDTNFRSGSAIVEAANKLIAYNSKQIPMVCKTDPARGEGAITRVSTKNEDDSAETMTSQILAEYEEAKQDGQDDKFFSRYGLAVRTNKELYGYAMKMIEKGIPFRSKKNFLAGPAIGPVIGIFSILRSDDIEARNEGVIAGIQAPDFGLNRNTVREKMDKMGVRDYYDFLVNEGGAKRVYSSDKYANKLQQYADYIEEVVKIGEKGSAKDVLDLILNQKGPEGDTFVDSLSAAILDDSELMEEVKESAFDDNEEGKVTPDLLAKFALAPIAPLMKAADRFPTAIEFVNYIRKLVVSNAKNSEGEASADAVQIDTAHGWKGLEVANLYVPMAQGVFPHRRAMKDPRQMDGERRLAYVTLTRGRNRVTILEPKNAGTSKKEAQPSQFVFEGCIPLVGPSPTEPATGEGESLKTARLADFLIPIRGEPNPGMPMAEKEEEPSDAKRESARGVN